MTKKGRFDFIQEPTNVKSEAPSDFPAEVNRVTVSSERSQLNVRIRTMLKRQALAKAKLEGKALGDIIEAFLEDYVN